MVKPPSRSITGIGLAHHYLQIANLDQSGRGETSDKPREIIVRKCEGEIAPENLPAFTLELPAGEKKVVSLAEDGPMCGPIARY